MNDLVVRELEDLIEGRHRSDLHRLAVDSAPSLVARLLGAAGWGVLLVALDDDSDKSDVLAAFAAAGRFPQWVGADSAGANWDALQDRLRDLSWLPAVGYAVLIDGWDAFAVGRRDDAAVLRKVLATTAEFWSRTETPFHVLLRA